MPTDFDKYVHFPGSSGYATGAVHPSIYPTMWDSVLSRSVSKDPTRLGLDPFGRLTSPNRPTNPYFAPKPQLLGSAGFAGSAGSAGSAGVASGGAGGASAGGGNANPFFTLNNVKDPEVQKRITNLISEWDKLRTAGLGDFNERFKKSDADFSRFLSQDTEAIDRYYNGDIQGALDSLRSSRKKAVEGAATRGLDSLSKVLALDRMAKGGISMPGMSSYLAKMGLDKATEVALQAALDDSAQARNDFDYIERAKLGLLGQRTNLTNTDLMRSLLPSQVNAQWFNNLMAGLSGITQNQLSNNFYGLGKPRGDLVIDAMGNYATVPGAGLPGVPGGGMPLMSSPVVNSPQVPRYRSPAARMPTVAAPSDPLSNLRNTILAETARGNYDALNTFRAQAGWGGGYVPNIAPANTWYGAPVTPASSAAVPIPKWNEPYGIMDAPLPVPGWNQSYGIMEPEPFYDKYSSYLP